MAKLTQAEWHQIREAYEVGCISTVALAKKYNVADTTIQRRIKKEGWDRLKTQAVIDKKVSATRAFVELTQENAGIAQAVNQEVETRLRQEQIFTNALEYNQSIANRALKELVSNNDMDLQKINLHSQVTNRNKEGILGKVQQVPAVEEKKAVIIEVRKIGGN